MKLLQREEALQLLTQSQGKGDASLLSYFKPKRDIVEKDPVKMGERVGQGVLDALEGVMMYRLESWVKALFVKALRLFFFFQEPDIFGTLILHDYGVVHF